MERQIRNGTANKKWNNKPEMEQQLSLISNNTLVYKIKCNNRVLQESNGNPPLLRMNQTTHRHGTTLNNNGL